MLYSIIEYKEVTNMDYLTVFLFGVIVGLFGGYHRAYMIYSKKWDDIYYNVTKFIRDKLEDTATR